jgi:hypothetical protein
LHKELILIFHKELKKKKKKEEEKRWVMRVIEFESGELHPLAQQSINLRIWYCMQVMQSLMLTKIGC